MKIVMLLDDVLCEGKISKWSWFTSLVSMAIHPTRWGQWKYFTVTDIKGNPRYENWDYIHVPVSKILWENFRDY